MNESALPELPGGWVWTRLEDIIIKISNGISERQINEKSNIMVTRIETISKGFIDLKKVGYLKDLSPEEIEKYALLQDDILFSNINSDLHLGKTAIFSFDSITLLHGMNLLLIRSNKECINPKLLHYLCNYYRFSGTFISIAQHAVNQSSINQSKLNNLPIPLPPLPEQRRIVMKIEELFTKLDAGVSELKKAQAQLNRYRQAVLKYAFEGRLTKEWRTSQSGEIEPSSIFLQRIKEERKKNAKGKYEEIKQMNTLELQELPYGWIWTRVDLLYDTQTGPFGTQLHKSDYTYTGIPTIEIGDVYPNRDLREGTKHFISKEKAQTLNRFEVRNGDVLFTRVGTVGRCTVVPLACEGWIMSTSLIRVRIISNNLLSKYLLFYFWSPLSQQFTKKTTKGTTRAGTNSKIVGELPLIVPPIPEQHKIVEEIERNLSVVDEVARTVEQSLAQAERLRQSILKRAFEGRLVAQDASDEPTGVLLERIKVEKMRTGNGTKKSKQIKLSIKDVA